MTESPPPPGWYADPRDQRAQRYWTGETWSGHVNWAGALVPPADMEWRPATRPRPAWLRVCLTVFLLIPPLIAGYVASDLVERWAGVPWGDYASAAVTMPLFAWFATKVSYRWFDALVMFIPGYVIFWVARICWRLAYLPYRDWPPREEEAAGWLQVRHPTEPGTLLYVKVDGLRQKPLDTAGRNAG